VGYYAYVVYHGTRKILEGTGEAGRGREMTANVAEYVAVLRGLEALRAWANAEGVPVGAGVPASPTLSPPDGLAQRQARTKGNRC
jgi:hypothetical protein